MTQINSQDDLNIKTEQMDRYRKIMKFYEDFGSLFKSVYDELYELSADKEYYKSYHEIIKRTADLYNNLFPDSYPLIISLAFEYLLWGGYFSKDHKYIYDTSKRVNNIVCAGADIMRGHGVCLNNADMLANVYKELGYDSHLVGISVNKEVKKLNIWKPNIERTVGKNSKLINMIGNLKLVQKFGNHAITIVKKDVYELYDPTSLAVLTPADVLKASYAGTDLDFDLKVWSMIVCDGLEESEEKKELSEITNILFAQGIKKVNSALPIEEYKKVCEYVLAYLDSNKNRLNQFYEENQKDIDIVCRTLSNERRRK